MAQTFFFYDLETSGVNPRSARIMQFAGQRTDMDLKPVGKPYNVLIKMAEDVLPEPEAIMVTSITPQKTQQEGISEAEFAKLFNSEIITADTIFTGFNSIRFDDEFMRFFLYRNFYDSYGWQWRDGNSRWDLLDVSRMTRALRPDGIKWPFDSSGKPSNRLELLSSINKLDHFEAHDALSDVNATIALADLIKTKQPKLFDYLLSLRDKKTVQKLADSKEPFVYTSGKYPGEFEKTTVVAQLCPHPDKNGLLVYDLRHDPAKYLAAKPEELAELWKWKKDSDEPRLPVKALQFNRCPAIAPLGVLNDENKIRLSIDIDKINKNLAAIRQSKDFVANLLKATEILNQDRKKQLEMVVSSIDVDSRLYDGFIDDGDKKLFSKLHNFEPDGLSELSNKFHDDRLKELIPLYKARNYPKALTNEEREAWEKHRFQVLMAGNENSKMAIYVKRLAEIGQRPDISDEKQYLLQELQLWAENLVSESAG